MRLWLLDQVEDVKSAVKGLIRVLVERADNEKEYRLPGYTHLQVMHVDFIKLYIQADAMGSADNLFDGRIYCCHTHCP